MKTIYLLGILYIYCLTVKAAQAIEPEITVTPYYLSYQGEQVSGLKFDGGFSFILKEEEDSFGELTGVSTKLNVFLKSDLYFDDGSNEILPENIGLDWRPTTEIRLFVGAKSVTWSRSYFFRFLDIWNGENLKYHHFETYENRQLARPLVELGYLVQKSEFKIVIAPWVVDADSKYPASQSPWCYLDCLYWDEQLFLERINSIGYDAEFENIDRSERAKDIEVGLLYRSEISNLNYSFILFSGFDRSPLYSVDLISSNKVLVKRIGHRVTKVGVDLSYKYQGYMFSSNLMYSMGKKFSVLSESDLFLTEEANFIPSNELEVSLGVEKKWRPVLVKIELYENVNSEQVSENAFVGDWDSKLALSVQYPFDYESFGITISMIQNIKDQSNMLRPEFNWLHSKNWQTKLGALLHTGSETSNYGLLPRESVYIRSQVEF